MLHIAVLREEHIESILSGRKRVESRLTRTRRAPFECVAVGDPIFFKQVSGPIRARAIVSGVRFDSELTPARVRDLSLELENEVCAPRAYWQSKLEARYATFVWLRDVTAIEMVCPLPPFQGQAWKRLDEAHPASVEMLAGGLVAV